MPQGYGWAQSSNIFSKNKSYISYSQLFQPLLQNTQKWWRRKQHCLVLTTFLDWVWGNVKKNKSIVMVLRDIYIVNSYSTYVWIITILISIASISHCYTCIVTHNQHNTLCNLWPKLLWIHKFILTRFIHAPPLNHGVNRCVMSLILFFI